MKNRVKEYHAEHHLYFDRKITLCEEWNNDFEVFEKFALGKGYKKGLQIDRENNDQGYNPVNCRFVQPHVNCNNRRNTVKIIYRGKEYPFMELIRKKKLLGHEVAIMDRMQRGYTTNRAFNQPIRKGNYGKKDYE